MPTWTLRLSTLWSVQKKANQISGHWIGVSLLRDIILLCHWVVKNGIHSSPLQQHITRVGAPKQEISQVIGHCLGHFRRGSRGVEETKTGFTAPTQNVSIQHQNNSRKGKLIPSVMGGCPPTISGRRTTRTALPLGLSSLHPTSLNGKSRIFAAWPPSPSDSVPDKYETLTPTRDGSRQGVLTGQDPRPKTYDDQSTKTRHLHGYALVEVDLTERIPRRS